MSDDAKESWDKFFGPGYYDFLLKQGLALGMPKERLARELKVSISDVEMMFAKYGDEIRELKVAAKVAAKTFEDLQYLRLSKIQMRLMEQLEEKVGAAGGLSPSQSLDFFKYLTNTLLSRTPGGLVEKDEELTQDQIREKALRLVESTQTKKVSGK